MVVLPIAMAWYTYVAGGVSFATLILLGVLGYKYWEKTRKEQNTKAATAPAEDRPEAPSVPAPIRTLEPAQLKPVFRRGVRNLKRKSTTSDPIYDIPWLLMVGPPASGKSSILAAVESEGMKADPAFKKLSGRAGCDWAFLSGGVVIEVAGDYLYEDGDPTSSRTGWGKLLGLLRSFRKARPIDGIVLTFSAAELLKRGAQAEVERELVARRLLDALQALQRRLGVRCPVYIIVSRCDQMDGFGSFVKQLPDSAGPEVLGWSNPYSLEATFRDEWLTEAYASVESSVAELQLALLSAAGPALPEAGELYLFRHQLTSTRDSLTKVVSSLFKSTVYLEPFMLRGVYFCGDPAMSASDEGPEGTTILTPPTTDRAQPLFVSKLFATKILSETGLTKLGSRAFAARLRGVRTVQFLFGAIIVTLATGIALATQRLMKASSVLKPVLNSMRGGDATEVADAGGSKPVDRADKYSRSFTVRLLGDTGELAYGRLRSLFVPSSYVSDLDQQIQSAVTHGYETVILPSFVAELKLRAEEQFTPVAQSETRQIPGAALEQTPAFGELRQRVDALQALEATAAQYRDFVAAGKSDKDKANAAPAPTGGKDAAGKDAAGKDAAAPVAAAAAPPPAGGAAEAIPTGPVKSIAELGALTEKLLDTALPAGFYANFEYHQMALRKAVGPDFDPTGFQEIAAERARHLVGAIYDSIFNTAELTDALRKVEDELDRFSRLQLTPQPSALTVQVMRNLAEAISDAESQARRSRLPMLLGSQWEPGEQFKDLLDDIEASPFFPRTLAEELRDLGQSRFAEAFDRLYKTRVKQFDSLLEQRLWSSSFGINARVLMLRDALEALVNADYLDVLPTAKLNEVDDESLTLIWDVDLLENARRIAQNYDAVRSSGFNSVGPEFADKLSQIAEIHALDFLTATTARSQRVEEVKEDESEEQAEGLAEWQERELANFKRAEPVLTGLIDQLAKSGFIDLSRDLRRVVFRQAGTLLGFADVALSNSRPYKAAQATFDWWDGRTPPVAEAYGLSDVLELKSFVSAQRQVVKRLARDRAQPLVSLLNDKDLTDILGNPDEAGQIDQSLQQWKSIIESLKQQEAKQPGNPIDSLESFILNDMSKVTLEICTDPALLRDVPRDAGEYFGDQRAWLRSSILQRCGDLAAGQASLLWDEVRLEFEPLMDKFPFKSDSPFDSDPVKVKRALDLAMDFIKKHESTIANNNKFLGTRRELQAFIRYIKSVSDFFATTLTVDGQVPGLSFDVGIKFRINQKLEVGASQVIDWRMRLARFEADLRVKEEDRFRWGLSDRVELSFRWATQAPDQPTKEKLPESARLESGTVSYVYAGPWALLRLLSAHGAIDDMMENRQEPLHPLVFQVETARSNVPKDDPDYGQVRMARLFVRIELFSPVSKARLNLPMFPSCTPDLERRQMCEGRL